MKDATTPSTVDYSALLEQVEQVREQMERASVPVKGDKSKYLRECIEYLEKAESRISWLGDND